MACSIWQNVANTFSQGLIAFPLLQSNRTAPFVYVAFQNQDPGHDKWNEQKEEGGQNYNNNKKKNPNFHKNRGEAQPDTLKQRVNTT